eukprot:11318_1
MKIRLSPGGSWRGWKGRRGRGRRRNRPWRRTWSCPLPGLGCKRRRRETKMKCISHMPPKPPLIHLQRNHIWQRSYQR